MVFEGALQADRVVLGVTRHSRHQEKSTVPSVKAPAGAGACSLQKPEQSITYAHQNKNGHSYEKHGFYNLLQFHKNLL